MRITALLENTAFSNDMEIEHGLSLYIQTKKHNILFDMGQSDAFLRNAQKLGIDLSKVDVAVLSHGHYDHGGGLKDFISVNGKAPVYVCRDAFCPHYNGTEKYIGLDPGLKDSSRIIYTEGKYNIDTELSLYSADLCEPKHATAFDGLNEKRDGIFIPDDFRHEQYLLIKERERSVLISGCSHRGIINIAGYFAPDVLVGGFHFSRFSLGKRLSEAAEKLSVLDTVYYTCHCTGREQYEYMKERMPSLYYLSCGESIEL